MYILVTKHTRISETLKWLSMRVCIKETDISLQPKWLKLTPPSTAEFLNLASLI